MPLDVSDNAWQHMVALSRKALSSQTQWLSPIDKRPYKIKEVTGDKITIERLMGGEDSEFGPLLLKNRLSDINNNGGQLSRQKFSAAVAIMSTVVTLHPQLSWSDDYETIIASDWYGKDMEPTTATVYPNIPNDEGEKQRVARNIRRGQRLFRDRLLRAYNKKCCITGCGVEAVLEAAHIYDHAIAGINQPENGLLLRSDIHILFDVNLITIDPQTHTIRIAGDLAGTEYAQYNGCQIANRTDGVTISSTYLRMKADNSRVTERE